MPSNIPQSYFLLNETTTYLLEIHSDGLTLFTDGNPLFELKESVILAQGTLDDAQQVHLAYIKNSGEFCYSVILPTGHHQTMSLGKLDTKTQRYSRLLIFPVGKVIHIFYANSHYSLPEVWRITHLFWNGQAWKSAQLGEVVHPRYPLYQVLLDSRSNLHVLMMTFLGNRSVLLASMFNGAFYIWSKRQEVLNIPREVVDMTAIITPQNEGHIFWAAKQPASDRFEIGHGIQDKMNDFRSSWRIDAPPVSNLEGPWEGLGILQSKGILNLLVNINQSVIFQLQDKGWKPVHALAGDFTPLHIAHKSEGTINYTSWLSHANQGTPLFAEELALLNTANQNTEQFSIPRTTLNQIDQHLYANADSLVPTNSNNQVKPPTSAEQTDSVPLTVDHIFSDLKESTTNITNNLESLSHKVDSIPDVIDLLKDLTITNNQTLDTLQKLEHKLTQLQASKEVAAKKGFWQRWLT